jgi:putative NIF3 family GTP cyclohydrolase 1 type 2
MNTLPSVTTLVQTSMQKLYPLALADRSWDNVGLLLEPPYPRIRTTSPPKVLLTIDLTTAVAEEALKEDSGVETIVAYRNSSMEILRIDPIIFRGLKSLTMEDPQQTSLLKLCAKGIGVYSPHTSVDGAVGGVNDWLAYVVAGGENAKISSIVPCNQVEGTSHRVALIQDMRKEDMDV